MKRRQSSALSMLGLVALVLGCEAETSTTSRCRPPNRNQQTMVATRWVPVRVTHAIEIDMGCCRYRQIMCTTEVPREMVMQTNSGWETPLPPCTVPHDRFRGHPHVRYWFYEPREGEPLMMARDISEANDIERFDALPICQLDPSSELPRPDGV